MIATTSPTRSLSLAALRELLRAAGPCITIVMPPYHPGEHGKTPEALLAANVREIKRELAEQGYAKAETAKLIEPLEAMVLDPELSFGTHSSRVLYRSPMEFEQFKVEEPVEASMSVGGCFGVRKLIGELRRIPLFYVLALTKTGVSLLRSEDGVAKIEALPAGVPNTLEAALALDIPDHDLENRVAAGSSSGSMHRIRFGTGAGHEVENAHLTDYYKLVDRSLLGLLQKSGAPLVLAGVEKDAALYRRISTCRNLIAKGVTGSLDVARDQVELLKRAREILVADTMESQESALKEARTRVSGDRFSTHLKTILKAAFEGRVDQLYLRQGATNMGEYAFGTYRSSRSEDLLNLAAVQTMLHDGKVFELPGAKLGREAEIIGLMRF